MACLPEQDEDYREHKRCILSGFGHLGFELPEKENEDEDKDKDKGKDKAEPKPIYAKVMMQAVGKIWNQKELKKAWNPLGGIIKLVNGDMIG